MSDGPLVFATAEPELPAGLFLPDDAASSLIGINRSLACLDATSHDIRVRVAAEEWSDKGTADAYSCRVRDYVMWWNQYQRECCEHEECWTVVPAFPVTACNQSSLVCQPRENTREGEAAESMGFETN